MNCWLHPECSDLTDLGQNLGICILSRAYTIAARSQSTLAQPTSTEGVGVKKAEDG